MTTDKNLFGAIDIAWAQSGGYANYQELDNELMTVWASYGVVSGNWSCSVNTGMGRGGD